VLSHQIEITTEDGEQTKFKVSKNPSIKTSMNATALRSFGSILVIGNKNEKYKTSRIGKIQVFNLN
jgi:hypothetical protein